MAVSSPARAASRTSSPGRLLAVLLAWAMALMLLVGAVAPRTALAEEVAAETVGDSGASFSNSDLRSDAADPCIIKVGETYYLFATTDGWGIPYYASTDLTNWTLAGDALAGSAFEGTGLSRGDVWAPEVRARTVNGRTTYVLTYTAADYWDREYRVCVAEATRIAPGAFGHPKVLDTGSVRNAIDSDLYFEGNETWLYFKNEDDYHSICVERLGADWSRLSGPTTVLRMDQPWESWTIEGPWMLKWGSTYYLMYSSGGYTTSNYCIGYATASSPKGPFTKRTTTAPLVRSELGVIGPGHNTTLMVADGEIYLIYHSLHQEGQPDRRLMIDRMGIDAEGRMFVNFSGFGRQPLPSGTQGYYQVPTGDYRVLAHDVEEVALNDVESGQSDSPYAATVATSSVTIEVEDGYRVSDVWLFGAQPGMLGTADLVINGSQVVRGYKLSGMAAKLSLPGTNEYVRTIEVRISAPQRLSEVLLVSRGKRWGVSVYRMYNTKTSEHLYTTNATEYGMCGTGSYVDWRAEGVAWQAPLAGKGGSTPVWRLYNVRSGDHHYTASPGEKSRLLAGGDWRDEGVAFYTGGPVAVYRVYNGRLKRGQHHYTTRAGERNTLTGSLGWRDEGVGFYALAA